MNFTVRETIHESIFGDCAFHNIRFTFQSGNLTKVPSGSLEISIEPDVGLEAGRTFEVLFTFEDWRLLVYFGTHKPTAIKKFNTIVQKILGIMTTENQIREEMKTINKIRTKIRGF